MLNRALISEALQDEDFTELLWKRLTGPRREEVAKIIRRARDRGEVSHPDEEFLIDLVFGPMWYRLLFDRVSLDRGYAAAIADTVAVAARLDGGERPSPLTPRPLRTPLRAPARTSPSGPRPGPSGLRLGHPRPGHPGRDAHRPGHRPGRPFRGSRSGRPPPRTRTAGHHTYDLHREPDSHHAPEAHTTRTTRST
ncbi:TetR-like C-terminal domain-containing protein [Streptomyces nogalater]